MTATESLVAVTAEDVPPGERSLGLRRREAGAVSARALLITILGEFALPSREPVWTGSVVAALGMLGVEEKAARQALARTAAEGLLEAERLGRRTRWSLSDRGLALLDEGAERIYGFMREQRRWDGNWLLLSVTVPESQRQLRHRLRTRLTWAGMGSAAPGLWVSPDRDVMDQVAKIIQDLGIGDNAMSWVGASGSIGDPHQVVRSAWQLQAVESAYATFIADFGKREPRSAAEMMTAQVELVQAWRRFPFIDPALPLELLDHQWPGPEAATTFHRCHDLWHRQAQAYWRELSERTD
jgi:phenylacetic acid degradation operon negative regulatory protein